MNNQWVTPGGDPIDSDWAPPSNPMPPSNDWNDASGCNASSGPAIVDGITITGVPAVIVAPYAWGITLNDGAAPPNFSIDHYDAAGALIERPIAIDGVSGDVTLTHDPTQELGAATKRYVDENAAGIEEAPIDNTTYGRDNGTWVPLPQTYLPEAPNTTQLYGRFNSIWALVPIQADAPNDGGTYSRQNGAWTPAVVGGPYVPISGATMTGALYMQGSNMIALNSPLSGGQSAIIGQKAGLNRWQLMLGDYTAEGLNNVGSNFSLVAFSTTGPSLGTWLTIARADGSTVFNGAGVTIQGGLAVNGILALASPNNLAIYGGAAGDVLSTNGSGVLSWVAPSGGGGGGIPDAPSTGQTYGRNNAAWTPTVSFPEAPPDGQYYARRQLAWQAIPPGGATISDTAPASPSVGQLWWDSVGGQLYVWYNDGNSSQWVIAVNSGALLAPASTTVLGGVKVDGTTIKAAADGTISTVVVPLGDNRIINGDMRIDQRNNGASGTANGSTVDRWKFQGSVTGKANWGQNLGTPSVFAPGFPYCLGAQTTVAYTTPTNQTFYFQQIIEADMVSDFAWGTPNAQPVTLSFWVLSSLTGTFGGSVASRTSLRSYPFSYFIPTANTWTKIVINIPGDTNGGSWVMSGNGGAIFIFFDLGSGPTVRGPANVWATTGSDWYYGVTGAVSIIATLNATFYVTGVKLEIGSVATPYNRQSMTKSLADCQRYYQSTLLQLGVFSGNITSGQAYFAYTSFGTQMRAAPTVVLTDINTGPGFPAGSATLQGPSINGFEVMKTANATGTGWFCWGFTASAEL